MGPAGTAGVKAQEKTGPRGNDGGGAGHEWTKP